MVDEPVATVDELMDRDPLELSAKDVDAIIAYHRKRRATAAAGGPKPKREAGEKVSLDSLLANMKAKAGVSTAPSTVIKRRI